MNTSSLVSSLGFLALLLGKQNYLLILVLNPDLESTSSTVLLTGDNLSQCRLVLYIRLLFISTRQHKLASLRCIVIRNLDRSGTGRPRSLVPGITTTTPVIRIFSDQPCQNHDRSITSSQGILRKCMSIRIGLIGTLCLQEAGRELRLQILQELRLALTAARVAIKCDERDPYPRAELNDLVLPTVARL